MNPRPIDIVGAILLSAVLFALVAVIVIGSIPS